MSRSIGIKFSWLSFANFRQMRNFHLSVSFNYTQFNIAELKALSRMEMIVSRTYHFVKHLTPPGSRSFEYRVEACGFHCHSSRAFGVDAVEKSSENGRKHSLSMDLCVNGNVSSWITSRTCTHSSCRLVKLLQQLVTKRRVSFQQRKKVSWSILPTRVNSSAD